MASFVHVTRLSQANAIRRSGIAPRGRGVFATPVSARFVVTHQWTRELMKWSRQPMAAVQFRIPDEEVVAFGRYGASVDRMTAAAAVARFRALSDPLGYEVVIARRIRAKEIVRIRPLRGVIGWRHFPGANGREPCGCPACVARGQPGGRRLRQRYEAQDGMD